MLMEREYNEPAVAKTRRSLPCQPQRPSLPERPSRLSQEEYTHRPASWTSKRWAILRFSSSAVARGAVCQSVPTFRLGWVASGSHAFGMSLRA